MEDQYVKKTLFCDHDHPSIGEMAIKLARNTDNDRQFVKNTFFFVRDEIRFGGDLWQVKASDTLKKKYGACYNKNLLFIALLRHHGIACSLAAHPMSRTFTRPATGSAHRFFSHPYYHCFTRVRLDESWITIDPTLDTLAWETFFKPCGLGWGIGWNDKGMPPLYEESIMGQCRIYNDIDTVLKGNLDSWFLFKHAPALLIRLWLWAGNTKMWMQVEKNRVTQPVV